MNPLQLKHVLSGAVVAGFLFGQACFADRYGLPPSDVDLLGGIEYSTAKEEDTLLDIARRFDVGQNEIVLANPKVDRWMPHEGTRVLLPKRYILPNTRRSGLVLNVPEMRLYYYARARRGSKGAVVTHPISIGRMDWLTPLGDTRIVNKVKNPAWRPPKSIKKEHADKGDPLPDIVPAGPDNPLGQYAMRLGIPGYLIHGTNKPFGVGMRVSHGCVRMLPEDIKSLFPQVRVGMPVHIVNQPIKIGWLAGTLYIEVHPPLEEEDQSYDAALERTLDLIAGLDLSFRPGINGRTLREALKQRLGYPVSISLKPPSRRSSKTGI